ncbi:MAG: NADH-quinone oxidoreductase subunit D [Leptospira sp.]|nr:MAG: NADH-quinone oxidoreductase subunit D [Leptospira sp.]
MKKIVILGAGYAGLMAANRLAKLSRDYQIHLINESENFIERIRNHEYSAGREVKIYKIRDLISKRVSFTQAKVECLDAKNQTISIANQNKKITYDYLIYALGSTDHAKVESSYSVNTLWKADELKQAVQAKKSGSLWILGAGLTGIELATELKESYPEWKIGLLDQKPFAKNFSLKARNYFLETFRKMKIELIESTEYRIHENGIYLNQTKTFLEADLFVQTFGFQCSDLGRRSNLLVNEKNQILVEPSLRVLDYTNIFVAGDSALVQDSILRMGCVTAMPMGVHAAEMIHRCANDNEVQDFSFGFAGRCISLGRKSGLIQMTNSNDEAKPKMIGGKLAAFIKELVCKYTVFSIRLERSFPFRTYFWPKEKILKEQDFSLNSGKLAS